MGESDAHTWNEINGEVERITYTDPQSGFTVAQIQTPQQHDLITVVGKLVGLSPGSRVQLRGHWSQHPEFGRQFQAVHCHVQTPVSKQGLSKYLGSGLIRGVGPETARRIVDAFGMEAMDIIESNPERLSNIHGIGAKRAAMIHDAWHKHKEMQDAMLFLHSHGVGTRQALNIFNRYGQDTIAMVQQNPYRLARDIFGIGFLTADRMAANIGLDKLSPMRLQAGVMHVLHQSSDDGHLFYPYEALVAKSQALLKAEHRPIDTAIHALADSKHIIIEPLVADHRPMAPSTHAVYLKHLYQCETLAAHRLKTLLQSPLFGKNVRTSQVLARVEKQLGKILAPAQRKAVTAALAHKVLVITGGPGTGKTTIVHAVTRLFEDLHARILLAAPTGRAAKRLAEATGRPAKTIHRLLEYNPHRGTFQRNHRNPLQADLLVIDECSMVDMVLMHHLLKATPHTTTLILVGDANQLPSVGPGNVFKDILASKTIPRMVLREIFRQAQSSRIVVSAHRINAGRLPDLAPDPTDRIQDFYFIEQSDPDRNLDTILKLAGERIPRRFGLHPVADIQVLTPMYRGTVGADNLNRQLQQHLNPQEAFVARGNQRFGLNDKVMQIRNNYEKDIFNGDIGHIAQIEPHQRKVTIRFDDRMVGYDFEALNEVVLAYAVTVHKSQGSEYPAVIIPVTTQHYLMLQRNLIYTAVTRAKRLVVLVGTKRALALAVKNDSHHKRYTRLAQRLKI